MILFNATSRRACALSDDKLTTGSVGIQVEFTFSDDWTAAPARIAVFRGSGQSVDVALLEDSCTVPPEVLTQPGSTLTIGVYGTDGAGTVVIPTVYAEAGQIRRGAEPSGVEPTPQTQPLIDQLLAAAQAARDAADEAERLAQSVRDDADAGEFDGSPGADGSGVWYTTGRVSGEDNPFVRRRDLIGREGAAVQVHDLLFAPDVRDEGEPTTLYEITSVGTACALKRLCKMQGEDGTSPGVTITEIEGGHRITITDEAHPDGQSFDVMDGQGGSGGTSDYSDLSNKPSIDGVTLAGNKTAYDLGLAKASDIPAVPVQSVNNKTGAVVLNASDVGAGTYTKPSGGIPKSDLAAAVQTSLGKADDALPASGNAYRTASIPMGQLDSTSTATVMTATIPGITELRDGVCVWLENGVIASASGVTLNINSLGAKPIYNSLSGAVVTTTFVVASTYLFVYNSTRVTGGCWDMVYGYDANTTYTPVKLGFGYATCSTAEATAAKTASLSSYTLTTGGIVAVKFTNSVPAGSTLNINSKGAKAIYYQGAAITNGIIKAGDTVTMIYSTYYHVLSIDRTPKPSDASPLGIANFSDAGTSDDYSRADHVHNFDHGRFLEELAYQGAVNIPVILTDATTGRVLIQASPTVLASEFTSQLKVNFALVVPPDTTNYPVLFTASKFSSAGELHLTGIVDGVLYEAVLTPNLANIMTGTMTTTNLILPSAQGVSF